MLELISRPVDMELKLGMALNYSLEKGIEVLCRGRRWVVGTGLVTPFLGWLPAGWRLGNVEFLQGWYKAIVSHPPLLQVP